MKPLTILSFAALVTISASFNSEGIEEVLGDPNTDIYFSDVFSNILWGLKREQVFANDAEAFFEMASEEAKFRHSPIWPHVRVFGALVYCYGNSEHKTEDSVRKCLNTSLQGLTGRDNHEVSQIMAPYLANLITCGYEQTNLLVDALLNVFTTNGSINTEIRNLISSDAIAATNQHYASSIVMSVLQSNN